MLDFHSASVDARRKGKRRQVRARKLAIEGAWEFTPDLHPDVRGMFAVWYDEAIFANALGHPLQVKQVNHALSRRGTIRGIHFAQVPPGQAKYVYCPQGAVLDIVIDLRIGSPTFGQWETVVLDAVSYRATYLAEGLGHAYIAQADDSVLVYLCSERYNPAREFGVNPFDADIGLPWPADMPHILSDRDRDAPRLAQAREDGLLPHYDECERYYRALCQNDR